MAELSAKQKAFLNRMLESDEYERQGVELLVKHPRIEEFFEPLAQAGLFDPARNPPPREGDSPGLFWIPRWHILDYLKALASRSAERNDITLGKRILTILRNVTHANEGKAPLADNHYTAHAFVEILGLLPTKAVSMDDIDLIPAWMGGRFDRTLVSAAFSEGTLHRYLDSEDPGDWQKACQILRHCTELQWSDTKGLGGDRKEAKTVVEDHWLKKIISGTAQALGARIGNEAAGLFIQRLREVYSEDLTKRSSWLTRPAIEEHEQNHSWDGAPNRFVEGLRDVLLSWIDVDPDHAKPFIDGLIVDNDQIVRRIAIHIVTERFDRWATSASELLKPELFDLNLVHETYRFLQTHFEEFSPAAQAKTIDVIRNLPLQNDGEKSERRHRRIQRRWLSAITGRGNAEADTWFANLEADQTIGQLQSHPDFNSYMESHWGFGDSPYTDQQLVEFAERGILVERLNEFIPRSLWNGPTARSLADTLEAAVATAPEQFLSLLPEVVRMKRTYQYAVISGFKKLWDGDHTRAGVDWGKTWPSLFSLFERIINDEGFWQEPAEQDDNLTPNRDWIAPLIADFVREGMRNDDKAFEAELLPRSWALVQTLLRRMEAELEPAESDAMTRAINSGKGKAIEALIDHALRVCRVLDAAQSNHAPAWAEIKPIFDRELEACKNANFDFSTLAGAYIAQIRYLDLGWYNENFSRIFCTAYPANCLSAISGLAFAQATSYIYTSLVETGVLAWALQREMKDETGWEHLIQRLALAVIWGQERIDGPHLTYLFEANRTDDLALMARFLWSLSNQEIHAEQSEIIIQFWGRCVEWSEAHNHPSPTLLSTLSLLACYVSKMDDRERKLLLVSSTYVAIGHHADEFIEVLERLAPQYPEQVAEVFGVVIENYKPFYDFEDRIKNLLIRLSNFEQTRPYALKYANALRDIRSIMDLYKELVG